MADRDRELIDLWISIGITLSLTFFNLLAIFPDQIRAFYEPVTELPIASYLTNGVYFWSILLVWVAYRRWRKSNEREREYLEILSSTGPEVILVIDPQRNILRCNDSILETFGYSIEEVLHCPTDLLYDDRRRDPDDRHEIRTALDRSGFHIGEARGRRKDGQEFPLEIVTTTLRNRPGAVIMVRNITERKKTEENLRQALRDLEATNQAKDNLLAKLDANYRQLQQLESFRDSLIHMIVHDMKTPLQVLYAHAQLLKGSAAHKLTAEECDSVDTLLAHSQQLDFMIKSVLDVSRLEAGKLPLNLESGNLTVTVEEAIKDLGVLARSRKLIVENDPALKPFSYDRDIILRVLANLLANAIKYTPPQGEIRVSYSKDGSNVRVYISDNGPGIPLEQQKNIFEKFGQILTSGHRHKGSSGLGLTFCKLAIETHGGQIGVFSEEGKGSTFWFTLPFFSSGSSTVSKTGIKPAGRLAIAAP